MPELKEKISRTEESLQMDLSTCGNLVYCKSILSDQLRKNRLLTNGVGTTDCF